MLVAKNFDNVQPSADGGVQIPDGVYSVVVKEVKDQPTKKDKPMSVLTLIFNNASDFPDGKLIANATRRLNLVIPEGDTPDKDDFAASNFLKAVMVFYGVERAQALQMLRTGIDTATFAGRSGHVELYQKHGKEKDADTGVEKEVTRQDLRLITLPTYVERKGGAAGSAGAGAGNAGGAGAGGGAAAAFATAGAQVQQQAAVQQQAVVQQAARNPDAQIMGALATNAGMLQAYIASLATGLDSNVLTTLGTVNPALLTVYMGQFK